jgi:ABC-type antimicrobial peptide transport system permease subunit
LGGLALAVAAVGVYGIVAYAVTRRTAEVGVRLALGADRVQIAGLFLRRMAFLLCAGLAGGLLGSVWLTRYIQSLLFQIEPTDALTMASMAALLAATALGATVIPLVRALRVDPARTLRSE